MMAILGRRDVKTVLVLGIATLFWAAEGAPYRQFCSGDRRDLVEISNDTEPINNSTAAVSGTATMNNGTAGNANTVNNNGVFDVTTYGAKADGKTINTMAFMKTWVAACKNSTGTAKVFVPEGTFVTGPVVFQGPCLNPVIFEVKGTIKATTDPSDYAEDSWFLFQIIDGLTITGGGIFDGQGESMWKYNTCKNEHTCVKPPSSIKFQRVNNSIIDGITSLNSKYFHFHITDSSNYTAVNVNITAPANSPNTDGMHISDTSDIKVSDTKIGTGDDCISIGQGVTNAYISNVFCGPGHGLSVGSLGKYPNEKDVLGIFVTNCTLSNTTNGARIKTYAASPPSKASNITYQDIIMESVKNPIIIDQKYSSRSSPEPSKVELSDVHFKNIKGTTISNVAVTLSCSSSVPCKGVELLDINLAFHDPQSQNSTIASQCLNAEFTTGGAQNPPPCPK